MARKLGFPALLGPPDRDRDLAYALIISPVIRPASKLSTAGWWDDVTLGPDLGVAGAATGDIYAAIDWLVSARTTSRSSWLPGTCTGAASPCSTCPPPGWKATAADLPGPVPVDQLGLVQETARADRHVGDASHPQPVGAGAATAAPGGPS
jgi:hypothetical protein